MSIANRVFDYVENDQLAQGIG